MVNGYGKAIHPLKSKPAKKRGEGLSQSQQTKGRLRGYQKENKYIHRFWSQVKLGNSTVLRQTDTSVLTRSKAKRYHRAPLIEYSWCLEALIEKGKNFIANH
jgi:hypothetical protein